MWPNLPLQSEESDLPMVGVGPVSLYNTEVMAVAGRDEVVEMGMSFGFHRQFFADSAIYSGTLTCLRIHHFVLFKEVFLFWRLFCRVWLLGGLSPFGVRFHL